jgi:hypothetical protein
MCKRATSVTRILAATISEIFPIARGPAQPKRTMIKSPLCHFTGLAVAALLLCMSNPAKATLLVYEGFNYTAGTGLTNASDASVGDS